MRRILRNGWYVPTLILTCMLIFPTQGQSQCNVTMTMSFTTSAPATVFITKTLSAPTSCMATGMMAFSCFPGAAFFFTNMLYAARTGGSPNPYCNWSCGCGIGPGPHVTINGSDGLPVELMDFSIEEETEPAKEGDDLVVEESDEESEP